MNSLFLDDVSLPDLEHLHHLCAHGEVERYVIELPAVAALSRQPWRFRSPVTVLVGDNGAGKSTVARGASVPARSRGWLGSSPLLGRRR